MTEIAHRGQVGPPRLRVPKEPSEPSRRDGRRRGSPRVLVVGLGNELLADGGVGVHAIRLMGVRREDGLRVAEVGTATLDALHLYAWADRVLAIDALKVGGQPGTIHHFRRLDMIRAGSQTPWHDCGLIVGLRLAGRSDLLPMSEILGVEPQAVAYGLRLSPPVEHSLPQLLDMARHTVASWQAA